MSHVVMVGGTMSSAGKSLIVTGLCRLYTRRGLKVTPFKAQNMSNNAAVCPGGGEIGRAQYVQALACGIEPDVAVNPILIKPEADQKSQIIVNGEVLGSYSGKDYYSIREKLWPQITSSLNRLRHESDLVIIEGAGSIAELNLKRNDIVNMAVAKYAEAPVLLTGNIDPGGIFAQLLGSYLLLEEAERCLIKAFIVNNFRGDVDLFSDGIRIIEEKSGGIPVAGVIPFLPEHGIPDEDAASFSAWNDKPETAHKICVIRLPHISNFDDFDPLKMERNVNLVFVERPEEFANAAAIILPGTKNTIDDMLWLNQSGMTAAILQKKQEGAMIIGICGGYQLMGEQILNPSLLESRERSISGLGLLPVVTELSGEKTVTQTTMQVVTDKNFFSEIYGEVLSGYEIHNGQTVSHNALFSVVEDRNERTDGCMSEDLLCFGTYLHGLFDNDGFRNAFLLNLGIEPDYDFRQSRLLASFDRLADHLESNLNMPLLDEIIFGKKTE